MQPTTPNAGETLFAFASSILMVVMVWRTLAEAFRPIATSNAAAQVLAALCSGMAWVAFLVVSFFIGNPSISGLLGIGISIVAWAIHRHRCIPEGQPSRAGAPKPGLVQAQANIPIPIVDAGQRHADDLMRLVEGMMADGAFVQAEADYLFQWLGAHAEHLDQPPFNLIYSRLNEALADGVLDEDEAADLGELFKRLVLDEPVVVEKLATPPALPLPAVVEPPVLAPEPVRTEVVAAKPRAKRAARKPRSTSIDQVLINYRDSMGFESEREVTVHSLDDFYLKGFCHVRGAIRTFRIDRIKGSIVRIETGEVLALEEWQAELATAG